MFLHLCVILFTGEGVYPSMHLGRHHLGQTYPSMHWGRPPWLDIPQCTGADSPLGLTYPRMHCCRHPPWADISQYALGQSPPPPGRHIPSCTRADTSSRVDGYCCGRYTSYWNAFLLLQCCRYDFTMTVNLDC